MRTIIIKKGDFMDFLPLFGLDFLVTFPPLANFLHLAPSYYFVIKKALQDSIICWQANLVVRIQINKY